MERQAHALFAIVTIIVIFFNSGCVQKNPPKETEEINIKIYLIDKYAPGMCFGMPGPVSDELVNRTLNQYPELVTLVKNRYNLSKDSQIFEKIEQLNSVTLVKTDAGYDFSFTDGGCCSINKYSGKIKIEGDQITDEITNTSSEQVPC